jgi:hypothetical protein
MLAYALVWHHSFGQASLAALRAALGIRVPLLDALRFASAPTYALVWRHSTGHASLVDLCVALGIRVHFVFCTDMNQVLAHALIWRPVWPHSLVETLYSFGCSSCSTVGCVLVCICARSRLGWCNSLALPHALAWRCRAAMFLWSLSGAFFGHLSSVSGIGNRVRSRRGLAHTFGFISLVALYVASGIRVLLWVVLELALTIAQAVV